MAQTQNAEIIKANPETPSSPPQQQVRTLAVHQQFEGPLPMAREFEAYERVLPGSADRIVKMAEKSLEAEVYAIKSSSRTNFISMLLSRLFMYALLGVAVYLVVIGKPFEAAFAAIPAVANTLHSTFKKQDDSKTKEKPKPKPKKRTRKPKKKP